MIDPADPRELQNDGDPIREEHRRGALYFIATSAKRASADGVFSPDTAPRDGTHVLGKIVIRDGCSVYSEWREMWFSTNDPLFREDCWVSGPEGARCGFAMTVIEAWAHLPDHVLCGG